MKGRYLEGFDGILAGLFSTMGGVKRSRNIEVI
jgi:hypothetical protein